MSAPPAGATRGLPAGGPAGDAAGAEPADPVLDAVPAVPGVAALHAGSFGTVPTHLTGRRVTAVAVHDDGGPLVRGPVRVTVSELDA